MNSNASILELNADLQFGDDEDARSVFWKALSQDKDVLSAERLGQERMSLNAALTPMLEAAARGHGLDEVPNGLVGFIRERHWHLRRGQQAKGLA